jgi:hypothetical protein
VTNSSQIVERLPRNLGAFDRAVRLLLGIALIVTPLAWRIGALASAALVLFAWVPFVTAASGWCPFYTLLGLSTRKR